MVNFKINKKSQKFKIKFKVHFRIGLYNKITATINKTMMEEFYESVSRCI